jgi:hypothetical protein
MKQKIRDKLDIRLPYYQGNCSLWLGQYTVNKTPSLQLISIPDPSDPDDFAEPVATCTVCVPEFDLSQEHVLIKSWSENEGMEQELQRHGIIGPRVGHVACGYCEVSIHQLLIGQEA